MNPRTLALWLGCAACLATPFSAACPLFASAFESDDVLQVFDDLCTLDDGFDDASTLANWQRIYQVEGWPFDQLEAWDIDATRAGYMSLMPHTSSWYEDLRGVLVFKAVAGDFVVSTRFQATNRAQTGAPNALYSLAGLFIRTPRPITDPSQWTPGGENYVFLSAGAASHPGQYQYEVKTTIDSDSQLTISSACEPLCGPIPTFELRAARLDGGHFILLRRPEGGVWRVHQRFPRSDMPDGLQVGLTTYTDWGAINGVYWPGNQFGHNMSLITDGNPDLLAQFDFVHFRRPQIPAELAGRDFSAPYDPGNPSTVSDAELLAFLAF